MKTRAKTRKRSPNYSFGQSLCQSTYIFIAQLQLTDFRRRARETISEKETIAQDSEESLKRKEQEAEERRKQSHNMVAESIKRELAESEYNYLIIETCRKHGITEQKDEAIPDVDDTDGLDPEVEFEAWRMRELSRIKKEKEEEVRVEQEREEIERRRALPEEQRLKEDLEKAQKSREEKPKGQQRFLQKYWHKGAFRQVRRYGHTSLHSIDCIP